MADWQVRLLGNFEVWRDQTPQGHVFETDSARALFAWLCLNYGKTIRRDALAALIWPDKPQTAALSALRTTFTRIRRALDAGADGLSPLRADAQTVTLTLTDEWTVDALRFEQAIAHIHAHPHRRVIGCPACLDLLRQAVACYEGELLAGLSIESDAFQDWLTHQREHFHRAALEAMGHLAERALLEADWAAARAFAERQLRLEPWREEAHRQMMTALAHEGQRTAALAQYQTCRRVLQKEFGADPEAETCRLGEAIREGHYPQPPALPTSASSVEPTPARSRAESLDRLPLVGRQHELDALLALLNQPNAQLINVVGEGGIGKTRLAIRAALIARFAFHDGARFVFLHPEDAPTSASSVEPMHLPQQADASLDVSLALRIADACDIALRERGAPEAQVIAALKEREYLLVLDSFEHTLGAAAFLSQLLEAAPRCAALVTSRQRLNLRREQVVPLKALSLEASEPAGSSGAQMFLALADRVGAPIPAGVSLGEIERLCATLHGVPLGIELAAACLTRMSVAQLQAVAQENLDALGSPMADIPPRHRSLQAVFDSAWSVLGEAGRQGLAMLSELRAPCPAPAALALAGGAQALGEILEHSLAHRLDDGSVWMHEHIRRFAGNKLLAGPNGPAQADQMRRRHAQWFLGWLAQSRAALCGSDSYAVRERLVASFEDVHAAWRWALEQGEWEWVAAAVSSFEWLHRINGWLKDAVQRLNHALSRVQAPASDAARRLRARLLIATAALITLTDDQSSGESLLREARALAEQSADDLLNALAMSRLGSQLQSQGRAEEARVLLEQALATAQSAHAPDGDSERLWITAETQRHLGALEFRLGRLAQAETRTRQALELAIESDNQILIIRCLELLATMEMGQGQLDESETLLTRALEISRRLRLTYQHINTLDLLAQTADARGDYARAQGYYSQSLTLARESGNRDAEMVARINLGISCDQMGDYAQALAHTQSALALLEQVGGTPAHRITMLANLSLHAHHNGQPEPALRYAREATELAQQANAPDLEGYGWDFQGHACLELGQTDAAEQAYRRALRIREGLNQQVLALETRAGLARVALARGDAPGAAAWVEPIAAHLLSGGNLHGAEETLRVYWTTCQVLLHNDDPRAESLLRLAAALLQERAGRLSDEQSRAAYLNVEAHRRVLQAARTGAVSLAAPA